MVGELKLLFKLVIGCHFGKNHIAISW